MKKIWNGMMIVIGTLIGAGFASGREMISFFNAFAIQGIYGIILSSVLFGMITYYTLKNGESFENKKQKETKQFPSFFRYITKAFTIVCFCTMLAAIGTYGTIQFHVPFWWGTIVAAFFCFVSFLFQYHGLERLNHYIVPMILLGMIWLFLHTLFAGKEIISDPPEIIATRLYSNWLQSAILYVGYNSILLLPILQELKRNLYTLREIKRLSVMLTLFLGTAGLLLFGVIHRYYPAVATAEMPTLLIAKNANAFLFFYYRLAILLAIFTTALSSGYAFLQLNEEKHYFRNCILICLLGVLLASVGFANLVNIAFPIFGYFGVIQFMYYLYQSKEKEG